MRKLTRNTLAATAVMVTGLGLMSTPAYAADPWTVSPGGAISGTNLGPLTAIDMTTGAAIVCDSSTASGSSKSGSNLPGAASRSWTACRSPPRATRTTGAPGRWGSWSR